ncbi:MAG: nucleotide exchange factor GrpE [Pirellulaceae bacterium]|nr:nucleotide exchange factor GrpE [Pirellulaceae bacterium]
MSKENPELDLDAVPPEGGEQAPGSEDATVDDLKKQVVDAEKRALIYQADLENFRRRKSKETQDALKYAAMPLINSLLQVLDNLDRALASAAADDSASSLRDGVELVRTQLVDALEAQGCRRIEALGQVFDPNVHEAIQMQPDPQAAANIIILEAESGFKLHDRVVRPAKVIISTGPGN